jgi:dipeptidase
MFCIISVSKKASNDGSIFVCQSDDNEYHDQRIIYKYAYGYINILNSRKMISILNGI